ncbi:MAG: UvrD-helicase domain-containing protein, partial [Acidimicrobiia bacterium]
MSVIDPQRWSAAIAETDGPQLVVAGPGTGKTEFLVRRVTHLLEQGVDPRSILVLTFSRRGAAELRRRIGDRLGRSTGSLSVSTFHSFSIRLLESHGQDESGRPPATLLTGPEQVALVAELLADSDPQPWPVTHRAMFRTRTFAADVADFLLRMSERRIDSEQLRGMVGERPDWRALPDFHDRYVAALTARNRIDYGTLLSQAVDTARRPAVTEALQAEYRYVIVDEYQDTSPAQAELLEAITGVHRNLTVAGDPHQAIYGFRGADVSNVARFGDRFTSPDGSPARRIVLDTSFRVPAPILD